MNKFFYIALSIGIAAFLATNALLMFGDKSILTKDVYVSEYERAFSHTYREDLPKEAVMAPLGTNRIYIQDREAIEQWLVAEGDTVTAGSELAILNEAESEDQRSIWESERTALQTERREVQSALRSLESSRPRGTSPTTRNATDRQTTTNDDGNTVELDINVSVGVEVPQDGPYAAAIAQAEQQLAAIDSRLAVLDAQLDRSTSQPALISPVDGIVARVNKDTEPLSVDVYSHERMFVTYLMEDQWLKVEQQDLVTVQAEGLGTAITGTVSFVSQLPAQETEWFKAYRALDPKEQVNPIAFYEVRIVTDEAIADVLPYGKSANVSITVNEAEEAVGLSEKWVFNRLEDQGAAHVLTPEGYGLDTPLTIAFDTGGKAVLTDGVAAGELVLHEDKLKDFASPPAVFLPFPSERPDYEYAKSVNWRYYVEYLFAR